MTNAVVKPTVNFGFNTKTENEIKQLLDDKKTKRIHRKLSSIWDSFFTPDEPDVNDISEDHLPDVLFSFYCSISPVRGEKYATQILCIRAPLDRLFRTEGGLI